MFSRFTEATHTFDSTHVVEPDGTGAVELRLPGPEGGGRWSHDGARIAVMTVREDDRIGTAVIEPDGTVDRVLDIPDPTLNLVCVVWSPDDERLACEGWDDTDETRQGIYTVDADDGSDLQRLTSPPAGVSDRPGDYSPDGSELVLLRSSDEEGGRLMTVSAAGGEAAPLSDGPFEDPGRFSPDGTSVLTSDGHELVILDLDGKPVGGVAESGANLFGAVWSPDGAWIAYSRGTDGPFADIFVSRPDGSDQRQVTDTPDNEITVEWGPAAGG
jgi:Tol biopolymer transport system component